MRVGFVGAGRMGLPMVERLCAAGLDLLVHARRPQTSAAVRGLGVGVSDDLVRVARDRDVVLVCVYDDAQLAEVVAALAGAMPAGAVLASHVTGRVSSLRSLAQRFPAIGVVDAPVSGGADDIRDGRLTVLLGGRPADRARVAAVTRAYADPVIETGELGSALTVKLINNLLLAANSQLVADAVRLGEALSVPPEALLRAVHAMSGASRASEYVAASPDLARFAERVGPFLRKDVAACVDESRELGVDLGLMLDVARRGPLPLT